ncbi:MAG: response regulator transcription factor [Pseudomonadota bacterium]
MNRSIIFYGIALALAAAALQWLDFQYSIRSLSGEVYVVLIAIAFAALGVWAGQRLTRGTPAPAFEKNAKAQEALGVSDRQYEVLTLLAEGHSNKEIAAKLFVSQNTVKTHVAHLYDKLDVSRRTQAVQKARELRLIP